MTDVADGFSAGVEAMRAVILGLFADHRSVVVERFNALPEGPERDIIEAFRVYADDMTEIVSALPVPPVAGEVVGRVG